MNQRKISWRVLRTKILAILLCALLSLQIFAIANIAKMDFTSAATEDYKYYEQDKDVIGTSSRLNREIASEGMVLLKNDNLLPLQKKNGEKLKVSIFGKNSAQIVDRGFGSSDTYYGWGDLYGAFKNSNTFEINPTLSNFYNDINASGNFRMNNDRHGSMDNYKSGLALWETPDSLYTDSVRESYTKYNDAAIVVLGRYAGEGNDLPTTSLKSWESADKIESARSADSHYLQLDINEVKMLQNVMDSFENVVILVNSANPLELGFLKDPTHYLYTDNGYATDLVVASAKMSRLKAAMHIAFPGSSGCEAIPDLLDGTINPSGRLADSWGVDFMKNPVLQNFGYNMKKEGNKNGVEFVHYDEDIYMGYRYFETRYITEGGNTEKGNAWYDKEVMYPFGYGLSYTDFSWELLREDSLAQDSVLEKNGTIKTVVKVTNKGSKAGKEVVQLYYNTPYFENGISKAHVVLGDFQKTKLLNAGESETLTFETKVSDMYSYDFSDANKNGFKGYELDAGDYHIAIASDAHEAAKLKPVLTNKYVITEGYKYETDTTTDAKVSNLFDDVSGTGKVNADTFMGVREYATRENNFKTSAAADKFNVLQVANVQNATKEYDVNKPWTSETQPTQAVTPGTSETNEIKLWHLIGRDYNDPLWEELLDQLTYKEMADLIGQGFSHTEAIPSIDKARSVEWDGPLGRRNSNDIQWVTNTLVAQTYNVELAYKQGIQFGNAGLSGGQVGGTYGIGLNTHRSPFGGRNFEYYSEDGLLSGKLAAKVLIGTNSKGTYHTLKHFAVNDQESSRNNVQTWLSEQAFREIYAKAFEIAVKEGGSNAIMAGVNGIGNTTCSESWALMTGLLRNEWGFKGFVITDLVQRNVDVCIRAGTNLMMVFGNNAPKYDAVSLTPTQATNIRLSTKEILYVMANSNVVNGYGGDSLDFIEYGGVNTLYAVEGVDNAIKVNKATSEMFSSEAITYSMLEGNVLPAGMTLTSEGNISGAPTTKGDYEFTVVANEKTSNKVLYPSTPKVKNYKLKIYGMDNLPDTIIYEDDDLGVIPYGHAFTKSIESAVAFETNGKLIESFQYSLSEGSELPEGLSLKDGIVSGVTTADPGTYFFTIKATSEGRNSVFLDFIVTVKYYRMDYAAVEIANIKVGETVAIDVGNATSKDDISIRYSLKAGSKLPEGLVMSPTGVIAGTVTRAYTAHKFTVVASAEMAAPREVTYKITVLGVVFDDYNLGKLVVDKEYKFKLDAAANDGGVAEVYFQLKEGSELPVGMKLLADGTILGIPAETGNQSFVVVAYAEGYKSTESVITLEVHDIYTEEVDGEISQPIKNNGTGCSSKSGAMALVYLLPTALIFFVTKKKI